MCIHNICIGFRTWGDGRHINVVEMKFNSGKSKVVAKIISIPKNQEEVQV